MNETLKKRPAIGITTGFQKPLTDGNKTKLENYIKAIQSSGGEPVLITSCEPSDDLSILDHLRGLLLTGGGDIPSYLWGEKSEVPIRPVDEKRAKYEISLVKKAYEKKIPMLGICLGMQVMNVSLGGTLYLDLTDPISAKLHRRKEDGSSSYHEVKVNPQSKLGGILSPSTEVNSRHHQAIRNLASDFKICAQAKDGIIEAIESKKSQWAVGVQWHPEDLFEKVLSQRRLFEIFISACQIY